MPAQDAKFRSTILFCRSSNDGTVTPIWDDTQEDELAGVFEVGLTIADRYLLERNLGNGGMGRVFGARDLRLDRPVAIKVVSHRGTPEIDLEAALEREAKLGASLNHRGIAAVYDFGFQGTKSYTVFEFIEGETLRSLLQQRGSFSLEEVVQIAGDLAVALDYAHALGVVHRDLKPENVCFTKRGDFKILDLGIARDIKRDLQTGTYSGTPAYSSPEQAQCRPTDGKSDQYSLALMLFELLTGNRVFSHADPTQLLQMHISEPPPRARDVLPDLPEAAEAALLRALEKNPDKRFATCQELLLHFSGDVAQHTQRHVMQTAKEKRLGFYVAHVAEESFLAKQLAIELERKQYSCWFYGRDAVPGIPFATQSVEAVERSQAVILLISRSAIHSIDFAREIEHAHRITCPMLPLLIDLSREEFVKIAPAWCRMLGTSPTIEYRRVDGVATLLDRIEAAGEMLGIRRDVALSTPADVTPPLCAGPAWATDANQIDIQDLQRVLFRNGLIDDFLGNRHRYFISATKGFGKTLLLTYKRHLLTSANKSSSHPITVIPEGRPYLDFMSEMRSLSARYQSPLSELPNTKRLWSAALRIAALSHHSNIMDESDAFEVEVFPQRIQRWLRGAKIQPTVVFKELTSLPVGEFNRLIDDTENFLDQKMRQIHGGTLFFIDKVDQAIHHLSREAWIAIQAGLIEAAWEVMNANSHLKVFASIRQEAFTNYQSDIKANLFSATTNLNYSEEELQALLDQLARCYEGCSSFADFVGLNVVRHGMRSVPEDSFHYVRRHTCGRPRDIVAIASELSSQRSSLNEKRLREIVKQTSSTVLVSNIFDEVRVFLNCLDDREARLRFLAEIPGNILDKAQAIRACERFNGLEPGTLAHFGEDSGDIFHPFRDLYYAGLLGVVQHEPEQGITSQRFRKPHDSLSQSSLDLPESPFFLIHPALDTFIQAQRTREPFLQFQHVPVGENLLWKSYYPVLIQIERQLSNIDDAKFVEQSHHVIKRIQSLLNSTAAPLARIGIESSEQWKALQQQEGRDGYDEALLWLEELLEEL